MAPKKASNKMPQVSKRTVHNMVKAYLASQQELKFKRTAATSQTSSTSSTVWALTQGITQGDGESTRDGAQIMLKHLECDVQVKNNVLITSGFTTAFRMIVFVDNFNQGTLPAATDILVASSVLSTYTVNVYQSKRFRILHDKKVTLTNGSETNGLLLKWHTKYSRLVQYLGTSDASASNGRGAVFVLFVTDEGTNPPVYSFDFLCRYTDS